MDFRLLAAAMFALATVASCAAPSAEDDPTDDAADRLYGGRRLSEEEAATLLRKAGFPRAVIGTMLCTIKHESNFYERASNQNRNGSGDYGLLQVNSIHLGLAGCPDTVPPLYDATVNTKCAFAIYRTQGLNAWYGYRKHKAECDGTTAPAKEEAPPPKPNEPPQKTDGTPTDFEYPNEGPCYSETLKEVVPAYTCVQSKFDNLWFQCMDAVWHGGGDDGVGPFGPCSALYPL